jgi:aryl-alcohol dehydrogenase-like predicted oxidoreductase
VAERLDHCGIAPSRLGYGAFKIGRNQGIKYPHGYELPDERFVSELLHGVVDLGITYFDTAPAYGLSEERIGRVLAGRREELVLSTKAGETFEHGRSTYDFTGPQIERSVVRSLQRLRTDVLDLVFIHSDGRDLEILEHTDAAATLASLKTRGLVRAIGFSGKTAAGAIAALAWADAVMVEYHLEDRSHEPVLERAAAAGVGVIVKKGLGSGHLPADEALRFVLANPAVTSVVVASLSLEHLRQNLAVVRTLSGLRHE